MALLFGTVSLKIFLCTDRTGSNIMIRRMCVCVCIISNWSICRINQLNPTLFFFILIYYIDLRLPVRFWFICFVYALILNALQTHRKRGIMSAYAGKKRDRIRLPQLIRMKTISVCIVRWHTCISVRQLWLWFFLLFLKCLYEAGKCFIIHLNHVHCMEWDINT